MRSRLRAFAASLESPRARPLVVSGLVLVLLVATAAAFGVAERLKLERSPVTAPEITRVIGPLCECDRARGRLTVRLRQAAVVTASIVDGNGEPVRVLAERERRKRGRATYVWDGRDEEGEVVRDGRYRLRLRLEDKQRTITVPTPIRVDTRPPRVRLLEAKPTTISPDGDGRREQVRFRYQATETGYARVEVGGELAVRGRVFPAGVGRVRWRGRIEEGPARPGTYGVRLVVVDAAGNRSNLTREVEIEVRYVKLRSLPARVRRGEPLRFFLAADAPEVVIRIESESGKGRSRLVVRRAPGRVSIPQTLAPGLYALVAVVGSNSVEAFFRVARR